MNAPWVLLVGIDYWSMLKALPEASSESCPGFTLHRLQAFIP